jgi:hypothetical protein
MIGITPTNSSKLSPRFYGPYRILERIGDVAYHLKLLGKARIHNVFHVRMLKKFDGMPPSEIVPLAHYCPYNIGGLFLRWRRLSVQAMFSSHLTNRD